MTKLFAYIILSDDDGTNGGINTMDVIEYDGKTWLVPNWLDFHVEKVTRPERIVLLEVISHHRTPNSNIITVDGPVPRSVFEGRIPTGQESRYVVIEQPDIPMPLPGTTH